MENDYPVYICPVCEYGGLEEDPKTRTFEICPQCGTEFGYQDCVTSHEELRKRWIAEGKPFKHPRLDF